MPLTLNDRAAYRLFGLAYADLDPAQRVVVRDAVAAREVADAPLLDRLLAVIATD